MKSATSKSQLPATSCQLPAESSYQLPAASSQQEKTGDRRLGTGDWKLNKGFTFIEILVVVTIIGVLTAIGVTSYRAATKKSRDGKRKADLEQIRAALEMYKADVDQYPLAVSCSGTIESGDNTYMDPVPCDPKNTGIYIYQYEPSVDGLTYKLGANLEVDTSIGTCALSGYTYCVKNP